MLAKRISAILVLLASIGLVHAADPPRANSHGAFRPVTRPKVPATKGTARTDIDRFILAALEAKRLDAQPARPTGRR